MLDRKLLVEALRIDNKDILPKFGSPELKKVMEAATEYVNIDDILDYEEGKVTREGAFDLMDLLGRGSVGIADSDNQPALNFILSGSDIYAHNMFTDEDDVLDATPEALAEYIEDQLDTRTFDIGEVQESSSKTEEEDTPTEEYFSNSVKGISEFELYEFARLHKYTVRKYGDINGDPFFCVFKGNQHVGTLNPETSVYYFDDDVPYESIEDYLKAEGSAFQNIKEFRRELNKKKAKLQKKLDKGIFYENFGQDEVRELRNRMPVVGENDDVLKMQKELDRFNEWCMTVTPKRESAEVADVMFLKEPNEFSEGSTVLAVFPDIIEQPGDEGRVLTYSHNGQHVSVSPEYLDTLEEATKEEYTDLARELEGQGYVLNILNEQDSVEESLNEDVDPDDSESAMDEIRSKLNSAADSIKRIVETAESLSSEDVDFDVLQNIVDMVEKASDALVEEVRALFEEGE
jgi:hypothetical protein